VKKRVDRGRNAVDVIEALEARRLLSASIDHRVLVIEGTRRGDTVEITREGRKSVRVNVNGEASTFAFKQFGKIRVVLGKGDDYLLVGTSGNSIAVSTDADAGDGRDTVNTGAGDDSIIGGAGDDLLVSYSGRDVIRAGAGNDDLNGGNDDDRLYGDEGNDTVWAGSGNDLACGNNGDDEMWDRAGDDSVYGNKGNDHFIVAEGRKQFKDRGPGEICDAQAASVQKLRSAPKTYSNIVKLAEDQGTGSFLHGDFSYDGNTDFQDLVKLAQNYNVVDGSRTWFTGDFTYDGNTDFNDLVKLAQNYNTALPSEPIPGAPANFEEDLAKAFASVGAPAS
jgi:Ca2+-binding RTX toxin-like protein